MERSPHQTSGNDQHKRLVVGWFSFTCCEDSTILFTELLNDHFDEWRTCVGRTVSLGPRPDSPILVPSVQVALS